MFKRLIYENWASIIPIIAFILTFGVFIVMTLRAFLLKKDFIHHMGSLPLEDEQPRVRSGTSTHE